MGKRRMPESWTDEGEEVFFATVCVRHYGWKGLIFSVLCWERMKNEFVSFASFRFPGNIFF